MAWLHLGGGKRQRLQRAFAASSGSCQLEDFWNSFNPRDRRLATHTITTVPNYKSRAIPMRVHSDGVPVGRNKKVSLKVISVSSMIGEGATTWDQKIPVRVLAVLGQERVY